MRLKILVDGNNCLHSLYPGLPLEAGRERLLNLLIDIANREDYQVVVYFDQGFPERKKEKFGQVELVFPQVGEPADKLIEEELISISGAFSTYIVTSDRSLRDLANLRKIICLRPEQLKSFLRKEQVDFKKNKRISFKLGDRISKESLRKLEALKKGKKV